MKSFKILLIAFFNLESIQKVKSQLENIFNCTVEIYGNIASSPRNLSSRDHFGNVQYLAHDYLAKVREIKRKNNHIYALGLVSEDLYVPELNFVFGLASSSSGSCIISLARLRSHHGGPRKTQSGISEKIYFNRILIEAVHELGHTIYFLNHCENKNCVMHFSNSLRETDEKGENFCKTCKSKIKSIKKLQ